MNGQFKAKDFDKEQLKKFAADLKTNGLSFNIIWKKRNKVVEESNTKTNLCSLEIEGKWFFRQMVSIKCIPNQNGSLGLGF